MQAERTTKKYPFSHSQIHYLLTWCTRQSHFMFLNGNHHKTLYGSFPQIVFSGRHSEVRSSDQSFRKLHDFIQIPDWAFGYFSYELKNEIEDLVTSRPVTIQFEHLHFCIPETVMRLDGEMLEISSFSDPDRIFSELNESAAETAIKSQRKIIPASITTKKKYLENIGRIKELIVNGEFYEMNYCIEYTADDPFFNPLSCYLKLNELSPMPFSCFGKMDGKYIISASPERFLKKMGDSIISQPIKGTIRRSFDKREDELLRRQLSESEKEKAENLMIVDLVRNDLARSGNTGSINVEELFGVYAFKNVYQMISTVSSRQNPACTTSDVIRLAFPMGSMTGAPKIRVMQEIDEMEDSSRGLYSGAIGFFTPEGDFDFNVVIRSILYDEQSQKISFHVGSAITYDSDPEFEYNECLLKAESLFRALS